MNAAVQEKKDLIVVEDRQGTARMPLPSVPADSSALMKIIDRAAVDPQFDVAKLEQLLAVKERWDAAEAKKAFDAAMAQFKADPVVVTKDKENKQYGSMYTTIGNLVNVLSAALAKYGLSARWDLDQTSGIKVTCVLSHVQGHSETTSMTGPADTSGQKNPLQQIKSTVTYLRIATLEAITGTASKEGALDDDGSGGRGMDESALADHLAAIDTAADADSLKKSFGTAWKVAEAAKDKAAMRLLTQHKDARKKSLGVKS